MATARGKLNVSFVVRLFTSRRHNKNPDRFSDRGFSLLRFSSTLSDPFQSEPPLRSGDDDDDQKRREIKKPRFPVRGNTLKTSAENSKKLLIF